MTPTPTDRPRAVSMVPAGTEIVAALGRTGALDGSAYLSRPGPRIVDSLEILAGHLHAERFPEHRPERWPAGLVQRIATPAPAPGRA